MKKYFRSSQAFTETIDMAPQENFKFVANPPVGRVPVAMTCPHCHESIVTVIEHVASAKTHILCLIISLIGCCLCAPWVYCTREYLAKEHFCPNCKKYLGAYDV